MISIGHLLDRPTGQASGGHLIVGHVTDDMAKVWLQGSLACAEVELRITGPRRQGAVDGSRPIRRCLDKTTDYTDVVEFRGLQADTAYDITADFRPLLRFLRTPRSYRQTRASFRTAPRGDDQDAAARFSFMHGSCNLSVVSINNLAAMGVQMLGLLAARASLEHPITDRERGMAGDASLIKHVGRWCMGGYRRRRIMRKILDLSFGAVILGTGGRWPKQPLLRSPFLKLEAMFAGRAVRFDRGLHTPAPGRLITAAPSGAQGRLAYAPIVKKGRWRDNHHHDQASEDRVEGILILVETRGAFEPNDRLDIVDERGGWSLAGRRKMIGYVVDSAALDPGYQRPAFTIHAGDQIYFDFPKVTRAPTVANYRAAYRDAWFLDRYQRSFMARGSHYMTLDDHEIIDQFSADQDEAPDGEQRYPFEAGAYQENALKAYREYVQNRHPGDSIYFDFNYGPARFFVMDTRTERRRYRDSQMIGDGQMKAFEAWLKRYPKALKFVVSSVPFVAEVLPSDPPAGDDRAADKWCGAPYRRQRDRIIDIIDAEDIECLVFLVGDMHCAYHASMTIGDGERWEKRRIHELAGGPINQLDYGRESQFAKTAHKVTRERRKDYAIRMHQFHGGANAVLHIDVDHHVDNFDGRTRPEVRWHVLRTLTEFDGEPLFDEDSASGGRVRVQDKAPLAGRIVFR